MNNQIDKLIDIRKVLMTKVGQVYTQQNPINNIEINQFLEFDYPLFNLEFEYYYLDCFDLQENWTTKFEEIIGQLQTNE